MRNLVFVILMVFVLFCITGCFPTRNSFQNAPNEKGETAGFLTGCYNGFISPISVIASLFVSNINLYEIHNNGAAYNSGFAIGYFCSWIILICICCLMAIGYAVGSVFTNR